MKDAYENQKVFNTLGVVQGGCTSEDIDPLKCNDKVTKKYKALFKIDFGKKILKQSYNLTSKKNLVTFGKKIF